MSLVQTVEHPLPNDLDSRVSRGVPFLDERYPGWRGRINREILDMSDVCNCIGGQLYRSYYWFLTKYDLSDAEAIDLGFQAVDDIYENDEDFAHLTSEWLRALAI
jgi:hypothetical protein